MRRFVQAISQRNGLNLLGLAKVYALGHGRTHVIAGLTYMGAMRTAEERHAVVLALQTPGKRIEILPPAPKEGRYGLTEASHRVGQLTVASLKARSLPAEDSRAAIGEERFRRSEQFRRSDLGHRVRKRSTEDVTRFVVAAPEIDRDSEVSWAIPTDLEEILSRAVPFVVPVHPYVPGAFIG